MRDRNTELEKIKNYGRMIETQCGHAIRPYKEQDKLFHGDGKEYNEDGFVNVLTRYGTAEDQSEQYRFLREDDLPCDLLVQFYEGDGMFAKIIDTPAEEALRHGFTLEDISDPKTEAFLMNSLEELNWTEVAGAAIRWARLFGGSLIVMLVDDGRALDEPLDWKNIKSVDELKVFDRSYIVPDYGSMFRYLPEDPDRSRDAVSGMPERYYVYSRYGSFTVHESRCLIFKNGPMPEHTTNINYHIWGIPEYTRLQRAIRDSEIAHGSAVKMLDRATQAVYKMKDLSQLLATEEGESLVMKRLQLIDTARGLLNSIVVDYDGEDYDFKQFNLNGVKEIIDATCEYLSALCSIPQTVLFGRAPAGMNSTGHSDLENYYNFVEKIQNRTLKWNLRYLLHVIARAGVHTKEIEKIPKINITFNPLWSQSEEEKVQAAKARADLDASAANTAKTYIELGVLSAEEIRKGLYHKEDLEIGTLLDTLYKDEEEMLENTPQPPQEEGGPGGGPAGGPGGSPEEQMAQMMAAGVGSGEGEPKKTQGEGNEPEKPEEKPEDEEKNQDAGNDFIEGYNPLGFKILKNASESTQSDDKPKGTHLQGNTSYASVGVLVVKNGKILCGLRDNGDAGFPDVLCGPGGHVEEGETEEQAAYRETEEEFGIKLNNLYKIGYGAYEPESGLTPVIYMSMDYSGEIRPSDEISEPRFMTPEELQKISYLLFPPFKDSLDVLDHFVDNMLGRF